MNLADRPDYFEVQRELLRYLRSSRGTEHCYLTDVPMPVHPERSAAVVLVTKGIGAYLIPHRTPQHGPIEFLADMYAADHTFERSYMVCTDEMWQRVKWHVPWPLGWIRVEREGDGFGMSSPRDAAHRYSVPEQGIAGLLTVEEICKALGSLGALDQRDWTSDTGTLRWKLVDAVSVASRDRRHATSVSVRRIVMNALRARAGMPAEGEVFNG